MSINCNRDYN